MAIARPPRGSGDHITISGKGFDRSRGNIPPQADTITFRLVISQRSLGRYFSVHRAAAAKSMIYLTKHVRR